MNFPPSSLSAAQCKSHNFITGGFPLITLLLAAGSLSSEAGDK